MSDSFRELSRLQEPDPRWAMSERFDPEIRDFRPTTIGDIHRHLREMELSENVPGDVRMHFDRTRNLALYSWFVYGFIPVADWHACASLELALKTKIGDTRMGLKALISHAIAEGWIKNKEFSEWKQSKEVFERTLESQQQLHEAIGIPFQPPNGGIFQWDYVSILLESLPTIRNEYAHGSAMLYPGTVNLRVVAEFINQLFKPVDAGVKPTSD